MPRRSELRAVVTRLFQVQGPLTLTGAQRMTGVQAARIRHIVQPPHFRRVSCEWATRRWEWRWAFVEEACDCGQPAWYVATFAIMPSGRLAPSQLWLCVDCARWADAGMVIKPRWDYDPISTPGPTATVRR